MKKIIFIILLLPSIIGCNSLKSEIYYAERNKLLVKANFPNSEVKPLRRFSYIFTVKNATGTYEVNLKKYPKIKIDTLISNK